MPGPRVPGPIGVGAAPTSADNVSMLSFYLQKLLEPQQYSVLEQEMEKVSFTSGIILFIYLCIYSTGYSLHDVLIVGRLV